MAERGLVDSQLDRMISNEQMNIVSARLAQTLKSKTSLQVNKLCMIAAYVTKPSSYE
jgi:hypothetical protein